MLVITLLNLICNIHSLWSQLLDSAKSKLNEVIEIQFLVLKSNCHGSGYLHYKRDISHYKQGVIYIQFKMEWTCLKVFIRLKIDF